MSAPGEIRRAPSTAQGGRLATQENIADLVRATLPGQLLLVQPRVSVISWLIIYGDNQTITSHCGIVGRDGYVIEALTSGVTKRPLMDYADNESYLLVVDPPLTPEQRSGVVNAAEASIGTPYNWLGIARIAWQRVSGLDRYHDANLPLYGDVLVALLALALPSLGRPTWPRVAWYLMGAYLLLIGCGALVRRRHRIQQDRSTPRT